ncbi:MAG: WecB/TagA/CpsF family glycosyltransferase [Ardenticatenales bacterium]|nr:WecB/TagA/CpsF family glycosyltransferase [Ardenticatenales bacterium]
MIPEQPPGAPGATAAPPPRNRRADILGTWIDDVTFDEAIARIADLVADGRTNGRSHLVVTPNPEMVVQARRDPSLAAALAGAALATPDGVGIRWAARMLGTPIRAVVPGSALTVRLAPAAADAGWRLFLLGAAEGVAAAAADRLAADHPGIRIAGTFAGSPRPGDLDVVRAALAAAAPIDVLLVAYGTPAQEVWLAKHLPALGIPVGMGVGGTFNFIAGIAPWPPRWVARIGLIWLWRLGTEPWRWRRQLRLVRFVGMTVAAAGRRAAGM